MPKIRLTCFPPCLDRHTRTLILGSFPGKASLAAGQYYAHPRNQFWPLLSAVLGEDLNHCDYSHRLERLHQRRIGLWDVIASCERRGSMDTAIRNPVFNDFSALQQNCPSLSLICFNGSTSGRFAPRFAADGFTTLILPSSSPANARRTFDEKLVAWRNILPPE